MLRGLSYLLLLPMRLPSAGAVTVSVANSAEGNSSVEAYPHSTTLPGTTPAFNQPFAFHVTAAQGQFASVGFVIGASTMEVVHRAGRLEWRRGHHRALPPLVAHVVR